MTTHAERVRRFLGLPEDPKVVERIETFIRCNGAPGSVKAAGRVAGLRNKVEIDDPWAYCIAVFNADIGRAVDLYPRLHLVEHGLRTRIDAAYSAALGSRWFAEPSDYLPLGIAEVVRSDDQFRSVQERHGDAAPPYLIADTTGLAFVERVPFWTIQAIVDHHYADGPLREAFIRLPSGQRLDPARLRAHLGIVHDARNEVAHHRGVSRNLHSKARVALADVLAIMEFDEVRAFERVSRSAREARKVA